MISEHSVGGVWDLDRYAMACGLNEKLCVTLLPDLNTVFVLSLLLDHLDI